MKQDQVVIAILQTSGVICVENFKDFPQMARFTLRDEGKVVWYGYVGVKGRRSFSASNEHAPPALCIFLEYDAVQLSFAT